MKRFRSIEDVELALAAATNHEEIAAVFRTVQRQRKLLGHPHEAKDPNSNRMRLIRALDAANQRLAAGGGVEV